MPNNFCPFGVLDNLVVPIADAEESVPAGIELFYEVIRVISGKYLFANDHLDRFGNSLLKAGALPKFNRHALMKSLVDLVEPNQVSEGYVNTHEWTCFRLVSVTRSFSTS